MSKEICWDCANEFGDPSKGGIGMWVGTCAICGRIQPVAVAGYDFGVSDAAVRVAASHIGCGFANNEDVAEVLRAAAKGKWGML